jgi:hypothetical protein
VVPSPSLSYLALWPEGEGQPIVSTLNAAEGRITSNMAIVPNNGDGEIDAYAAGITQLVLDADLSNPLVSSAYPLKIKRLCAGIYETDKYQKDTRQPDCGPEDGGYNIL